MKYILLLSMIVCNVCYGQDGSYQVDKDGTIHTLVDSIKRELIEINGKKYPMQINYRNGQVLDSMIWIVEEADTIPTLSHDAGETTIGIITAKKHLDTIKVYAILKDKSTKRQSEAFIYDVRQQYKKVDLDQFTEPKYYYQHVKYLGKTLTPFQNIFQ